MRIVNPTAVLGETAACEYLIKKGYKILERNFRKSYGEIDIIALQNKTLIFVEVKTRTNDQYGTPFDSISPTKLKTLKKGAEFYAYVLHPNLGNDIRMDAIGVMVKNGKVASIEHIEGV